MECLAYVSGSNEGSITTIPSPLPTFFFFLFYWALRVPLTQKPFSQCPVSLLFVLLSSGLNGTSPTLQDQADTLKCRLLAIFINQFTTLKSRFETSTIITLS